MKTLRHTTPRIWGRCRLAALDVFPATPGAAFRARAFTREALARWGLEQVSPDACLLVSELVTNGIRASTAARPCTVLLQLRLVRHAVLIEVGDHNPQPPLRPPAMPAAESSACQGRGLPIVARLSSATGWYRQKEWKIVWAKLGTGHVARAAQAVGQLDHLWGRTA